MEPATAVVSLVSPEAMHSIRSSFCNQVHYFASREDAAGWLTEHPMAQILTVADAFEAALGRLSFNGEKPWKSLTALAILANAERARWIPGNGKNPKLY